MLQPHSFSPRGYELSSKVRHEPTADESCNYTVHLRGTCVRANGSTIWICVTNASWGWNILSRPVVKAKLPVSQAELRLSIRQKPVIVGCVTALPIDLGSHKNGSQGRARRLAGCTILGGGCHARPRPPVILCNDWTRSCDANKARKGSSLTFSL